jgi:hypothetical protein
MDEQREKKIEIIKSNKSKIFNHLIQKARNRINKKSGKNMKGYFQLHA